MNSLGRRESVAIGVVLMIVVIAAGWFLLVKPASAKVSDLKAQATEQEDTNESARVPRSRPCRQPRRSCLRSRPSWPS